MQAALSKPSFLTYFDNKLNLYIDLDISKDFGFGAIVYYVLKDTSKNKDGYL